MKKALLHKLTLSLGFASVLSMVAVDVAMAAQVQRSGPRGRSGTATHSGRGEVSRENAQGQGFSRDTDKTKGGRSSTYTNAQGEQVTTGASHEVTTNPDGSKTVNTTNTAGDKSATHSTTVTK